MGRKFFVEPETVTLPLFDDGQHWIQVKRQLNAGETKQLAQGAFSRLVQTGDLGEQSLAFDMNFEAAAFLKIMLYLTDWNLPDKDGKTVDIQSSPKTKKDALRNLYPDVLKEIERVIDAHAVAEAGSKNPTSGERGSSTSSTSLV